MNSLIDNALEPELIEKHFESTHCSRMKPERQNLSHTFLIMGLFDSWNQLQVSCLFRFGVCDSYTPSPSSLLIHFPI